MMIHELVSRLAAREDGKGIFVSLYLDTTGGDGARKEKFRILVKQEVQQLRDALGNGSGQDAEAAMIGVSDRILRYIDEELEPATRGVAIFAAPGEELFEAIQLRVPVETSLRIDSRPHLRQLIAIREKHPHVIVFMADARSARIHRIEMGEIIETVTLEDETVPGRSDQGGWSQANFQRHVQDHIDHHHKSAAERLARMVEQRAPEAVLLAGQDRNVANVESFLPARVAERLLDPLHLDMRASGEEIIEAAEKRVGERRSDELSSQIDQIEALASAEGRAAVGFANVLRAANERRIDRLLVAGEAGGLGWKCSNCSMIGEKIPLGCPSCGEGVVTVDLIEQLISSVHADNARVSFSDSHEVLDRHDGVAALLRF